MRSAELVGVAQPIARCGEIGGISRRREVAQRRVRTLAVVVAGPVRDLCPGMIEAEEQALVEKFVSHAAIEALAEAVLHRLSRRDEMPDDRVVVRPGRMAFEVNSVPLSDTIMPGLPRRSIKTVSSRATRRPEIDVSEIAAKHSRVMSSTMFRMRSRRPQASWSWTKSTDQRAFGLDSTRIGARDPSARRRARRLRTVRPSS